MWTLSYTQSSIKPINRFFLSLHFISKIRVEDIFQDPAFDTAGFHKQTFERFCSCLETFELDPLMKAWHRPFFFPPPFAERGFLQTGSRFSDFGFATLGKCHFAKTEANAESSWDFVLLYLSFQIKRNLASKTHFWRSYMNLSQHGHHQGTISSLLSVYKVTLETVPLWWDTPLKHS